MFTTVRPADMSTPYDTLIQQNVHFGSPDARAGNNLKNVMVMRPPAFSPVHHPWRFRSAPRRCGSTGPAPMRLRKSC